MQAGFKPKLVLSPKGHLMALGTGSDACTEHESGIKPLIQLLCGQGDQEASVLHALRSNQPVRSQLGSSHSALQDGLLAYPDLVEQRRIVQNLDRIRFEELKGTTPEAQLIVGLDSDDIPEHELRYPHPEFLAGRDENVAAAWCESAFAIRLRGPRYVKALRGLYHSMLAGQVAFAGKIFRQSAMHLTGVTLVSLQHLTEDLMSAIADAQRKYESELRLKARDDTPQLYQELMGALETSMAGKNSAASQSIHLGYLWPEWADSNESAVVYGFNPGYGVRADYLGPYTREQLLDWARTGMAYQLHRT